MLVDYFQAVRTSFVFSFSFFFTEFFPDISWYNFFFQIASCGFFSPTLELQNRYNNNNNNGIYRFIGLVGRVFANDLEERGSITGRIIPKTQNMVLDASLFNTYHYKVHIKGKVNHSRERNSALLYISVK